MTDPISHLEIDTHRHLSGSVPPSVVFDLLDDRHNEIYPDIESVRRSMTYDKDYRPRTFDLFLSKFDVFRLVDWDEKKIDFLIDASMRRAKDEGLKISEIHYTVVKYLPLFGNDFLEAAEYVAKSLHYHASTYGIQCRPVLSIETQYGMYDKYLDDRVVGSPHIYAVGSVGDERKIKLKELAKVINKWKETGKVTMMHVAECVNDEDYFDEVVNTIYCDRMQHATNLRGRHRRELQDRGVIFDVSLTSNLLTGAWTDLATHPIHKMVKSGHKVTIGTDDPCIFNKTVKDELTLLEYMGIKINSITIPE